MRMMMLSRSAASFKILRSCHNQLVSSCSLLRKNYSSFSSYAAEELPLPYSSPLLMLPPEYIKPNNNDETLGSHNNIVNFHFFSPTQNKFMKLSNRKLPPQICPSLYRMSSNGWLACVNRNDCRIYLVNLFTSSDSPQIIPLPPVETLFNVRRFETNPSSKAFNKFLVFSDFRCDRLSMRSPSSLASSVLCRIALSSDPNKDENCTVMIHDGITCALAFCRIGDSAWTSLKKRCDLYHKMVYSKKDRLFYTTNDCKVEGWDLNDPSSPRRIVTDVGIDYDNFPESLQEKQAEDISYHTRCYLVESPEGDILCVTRNYSRIAEDGSFTCEPSTDPSDPGPFRTTWFNVYKVDIGNKRTDRVKCLGDSVLFVSWSEAFSVRASDYPGLKPNSIYFDDDAYYNVGLSKKNISVVGHDNGVFDFQEKTVAPLYEPVEMKKTIPTPLWIFPNP